MEGVGEAIVAAGWMDEEERGKNSAVQTKVPGSGARVVPQIAATSRVVPTCIVC